MKKLALLVLALAGSALAVPASILSDDWVVKPGSTQMFGFELAKPTKVHLDIRGVKNANKGFRVRLVPDIAGNGEVTKTFNRELTLPAGKHELQVTNSENMLERATVRVSITTE